MTNRLGGKSALITGASSGIGRAIARRFAAEGARLVLADITRQAREGGLPTAHLLRAEGHDVEFIQMDVASEQDAARAVDTAVRRFGRLDVLVNDAAIGIGKTLTDTSLEEWNRVLSVNLTGVFLMSRAAVVQMLKQDILQPDPWPDRQHLVPARHDRLSGGYRLWNLEVRGGLHDAPDRRGLCEGSHHLQRGGAGQDRHWKSRQGGRAALDGLLAGANADAPVRHAGRCRQRGAVPGFRRGDVHHRREYPGRRRLDGGMTWRKCCRPLQMDGHYATFTS
jgi:NAD(P)-dependent dehydrogenase (short-subunit alcohol dehydrogenase family)